MKKQIEQVKHFHKIMGIKAPEQPTLGNLKEGVLRYKILREENEEYLDAVESNNMVEIADALTDQLYVVIGNFVHHGLEDYAEQLLDEVHRSNTSKLDDNGNPIRRSDGKVIKSKNYFKPDIGKILK